jgi:hypothetical protein
MSKLFIMKFVFTALFAALTLLSLHGQPLPQPTEKVPIEATVARLHTNTDSVENAIVWTDPFFVGPSEEMAYRKALIEASIAKSIIHILGNPDVPISDLLWKDFRKTQIDYPNFTLGNYIRQLPMAFSDTTGLSYIIQFHYTENDSLGVDLCSSLLSQEGSMVSVDIVVGNRFFDAPGLFMPSENQWAESREDALTYLLLLNLYQLNNAIVDTRAPNRGVPPDK